MRANPSTWGARQAGHWTIPRGGTSLPTQEAEYSFSGFIPTNKQTNKQTNTWKSLKSPWKQKQNEECPRPGRRVRCFRATLLLSCSAPLVCVLNSFEWLEVWWLTHKQNKKRSGFQKYNSGELLVHSAKPQTRHTERKSTTQEFSSLRDNQYFSDTWHFAQIELSAKLLDYFVRRNKSNRDQSMEFESCVLLPCYWGKLFTFSSSTRCLCQIKADSD